ncbi:MAG: alkaline phosphatase D family protein, partial [Acidimicrobiia bacterium]|nr:alkaline phosphatase D family protein [Acidimicrobiia bacterium]
HCTAPAPGAVPTAAMRLVAASCQRYPDGLYGAYRHVVADAPDVVVWCGDYVYERAADGVRSQPAGEASDLASYRALYAHYRGDAELQRAHAACPWIVTWDDHEVADNYAGALANGVDGTSEEASASFLERRAAAYRAWWEHMPVRIPAPDGPDLAIHRRLDWGGLVTLAVLDGRQYRSDQPCGVAVGDLCDAADDPAATMLGADQEGWLAGVLDDSARRAAPWTVLVNQTVLTSARVRAGGRTLAAFDQWDGYGAARDRLLAAAVAVGVPERTNLVVLTGDIHASLVGEVERDGSPVGVEFVSPSISSALSAERASQLALTPLLVRAVRVADGDHRGYVLHEIDPSRWRASYRWLDDATVEQPPLVAGAPRFEVRRGEAGVRQI